MSVCVGVVVGGTADIVGPSVLPLIVQLACAYRGRRWEAGGGDAALGDSEDRGWSCSLDLQEHTAAVGTLGLSPRFFFASSLVFFFFLLKDLNPEK